MLLRDFIGGCAATYPQDLAYISGDIRRNWMQVHARTDWLAAALQSLRISSGDSVAIMARNRIEIAEHWLACLKIGAIRVGINWRYSPREILHVIRDSNAKVILVEAGCVAALEPYFTDLRAQGCRFVGLGPGHGLELDYETLVRAGGRPDCPPLADTDGALIGYTSGSTGLPKGVLLTQANVRESAIHLSLGAGFSFGDVRLPFMQPAGVNIANTCMNVVTGMTVIIEEFDAGAFPDLVAQHRVTHASLVPTMLRRTLDTLRTGHHDVSSLRQIMYGTMPTPPALIRSAYETLDCRFLQLYGASESSGPVTVLRDSDHRRALAAEPELLTSAGRVLPHARVSIRGEDGRELPQGESGRVWIGGDIGMAGYVNLPEEKRDALSPPWLRTGDLGRVDERGYIFLGVMIISGAFNVFPVVVENVLAEHPAIRECAVVGAPHPEWGEAVVAVVSLRPGTSASPQELIDFCRGKVGKWEVPKHVEIIDELPKGGTHKIAKHQLREGFRQHPETLPWGSRAS